MEEIGEKNVGEGSPPLDTHCMPARILKGLETTSQYGPNSSDPSTTSTCKDHLYVAAAGNASSDQQK